MAVLAAHFQMTSKVPGTEKRFLRDNQTVVGPLLLEIL
jgi:hypothetical protein